MIKYILGTNKKIILLCKRLCRSSGRCRCHTAYD
uniref:Uncharacterized protein n=1 Tax=Vitis vinifera TaxID=29760 RepID=F6I2R6_VITVI